jgi:RHH-type proline utilization regulon transcriptional repressor/proline dehydrogenase/delta 1-pyrroline-5-carboxylate dehydrogenase
MPKSLSYYLTQDEEEAVNDLLAALSWNDDLAANTQNHAVDFIKRIRKTRRKAGSLESFFEQYGLNTSEGLALMSMAEALLRIPDPKTASALIRDKVAGTNWLKSASATDKDWMTKAAGLGLKLTGSTMNSLFSKLGEPVIRQAMGRAMKILGKQFVIGENLSAAMKVAHKFDDQNFRFSYDMLGEGARTASDATRYFEGYKTALQALADGEQEDTQSDAPANRSGISIKLSALHPRYELAQSDRCITPLTNKLIELCEIAAKANIGLTIDAEEVARLDPSLKIIENICLQPQFSTWRGFGLAVQAYQKSAAAILDHVISLARTYDRHLQVRLVKGAYWDTEIKHAQVEGYANYPVFTRKSNTDLSYLRCAQKLLKNRDVLYPMFGTHNAHTVAAILEMAKLYEHDDKKSFEFQKLFGMGDALYNLVANDEDITVCVYAPVGPYEDLLPYLVRRMLENGANSSFVNQIYDKTFEPADIADDPVVKSARRTVKHHPNISLPKDIYGVRRLNSKGFDFDDPDAVKVLLKSISGQYIQKSYKAAPILNGKKQKGVTVTEVTNPVNQKDVVGKVTSTALSSVDDIISAAQTGQKIWSSTAPQVRAKTLEKIANKLEENETELMALCVREGGRTLKDAHAEIREAVDFCRYYAMRGMIDFNPVGRTLVSPTGESNIFRFKSRGIFVCISPWNFPIAIFTGQIVAALMAGNAVIAKPAEQTNLIGCLITRLMHEAGVPPEVLSFAPGDGQVGAALVERDEIAGVAFTGSTEVAKIINQSLAAKEGAIPKLIAETGGQNAMIVDSSALTEQVVDDVMLSAFGSAGQRCSACRILYLQDEIADKTILMLQGALAELRVGDPSDLSSDIGPLIDEEALMIVQKHKSALSGFGHKLAEAPLDNQLKAAGNFFAPAIFEIDSLNALEREIFGPILHVIRYKASDIDAVIDEINDTGYGLTFGIHSRIDSFIDDVSSRIHAGNVYVNRGTIGAVVGVQPFGGRGLSGTGPKAGGPYYLHGFATEQVISTDTTAAGGNASLVMIEE